MFYDSSLLLLIANMRDVFIVVTIRITIAINVMVIVILIENACGGSPAAPQFLVIILRRGRRGTRLVNQCFTLHSLILRRRSVAS